MISIQSSLTELERSHQIRAAILESYVLAIRNIAHYAVEFDEQLTAPHRNHLDTLAGEVAAGTDAALHDSRATLRGLLRDYRDKAAGCLSGMREELAATTRTLEEILDSLGQVDGDHEANVRKALGKLREISAAPGNTSLSEAISAAANTIENSLEQVRTQHQLSTSQFLVEIRILHKRIDALEAAAAIDQFNRLANREEMVEHIRSTPSGGYCLLLIVVRGLRLAEVHFGREVGQELAGAFAKRLRNCLPDTATIGAWGPEEFVTMLDVKMPEATTTGKWITEHLSGAYTCLKNGKTVRPSLHVTVGIVDTSTNQTPDHIVERIGVFLVSSN